MLPVEPPRPAGPGKVASTLPVVPPRPASSPVAVHPAFDSRRLFFPAAFYDGDEAVEDVLDALPQKPPLGRPARARGGEPRLREMVGTWEPVFLVRPVPRDGAAGVPACLGSSDHEQADHEGNEPPLSLDGELAGPLPRPDANDKEAEAASDAAAEEAATAAQADGHAPPQIGEWGEAAALVERHEKMQDNFDNFNALYENTILGNAPPDEVATAKKIRDQLRQMLDECRQQTEACLAHLRE